MYSLNENLAPTAGHWKAMFSSVNSLDGGGGGGYIRDIIDLGLITCGE